MWAERKGNQIIVWPSIDDMDTLEFEAQAVGERVGATQSDAKIELRHLSELEKDTSGDLAIVDRKLVTLGGDTLPRAQLFTNGDLAIYLSSFAVSERPIEGLIIERSQIETPLVKDPDYRRGLLEASIPEGGVLLDFNEMHSSKSRP